MSESNIYLIVFLVYVAVLIPDVIKLYRIIRRPGIKVDLENYFLKINLIVLLFGVILLVSLITFEVNIFNYSRPIEHSDYKKISLKDFNGFKLPGMTLQGSNQFAYITSNIDYSYTDEAIKIRALFHPSRSYVYIDDLEDPELLRHEIYHFHITEVWARIFRNKLSGFNIQPNRSEVNEIFLEIQRESSHMQQAYDFDTDHGFLLGHQIEWQNKIDSLLKYYKNYEDTRVPFF